VAPLLGEKESAKSFVCGIHATISFLLGDILVGDAEMAKLVVLRAPVYASPFASPCWPEGRESLCFSGQGLRNNGTIAMVVKSLLGNEEINVFLAWVARSC